jgi:predicted ester cyclase
MTRDEIVAFFERRLELYDDLDAAGLAADYADDAVIESPIAGVHTGRMAAEQALKAVFAAFVDRSMKSVSLLIDGDRVAQVLAIEGTLIGEFMGLRPTGKPFHHTAVFLYELRDRKIARAAHLRLHRSPRADWRAEGEARVTEASRRDAGTRTGRPSGIAS